MEEGDGAQLRVAGSAGARALQRGADGAQQDAEYGADELRVVGQEGADPLRRVRFRCRCSSISNPDSSIAQRSTAGVIGRTTFVRTDYRTCAVLRIDRSTGQ